MGLWKCSSSRNVNFRWGLKSYEHENSGRDYRHLLERKQWVRPGSVAGGRCPEVARLETDVRKGTLNKT